MNRCPYGCRTCGRACSAAQRQSHRFDCCGVIEAHAPVAARRGPRGAVTGEPSWQRITNPMRAGWLTGPSQTQPPGASS